MYLHTRRGAPRQRRARTWTEEQLAIVDWMAASGVSPTVRDVRRFLSARPDVAIGKTDVAVALKLRDIMKS